VINNAKAKTRMSPPVQANSSFSTFAALPQFLVAKPLPRFFSRWFGLRLIESAVGYD
jgi:hypothetical protein